MENFILSGNVSDNPLTGFIGFCLLMAGLVVLLSGVVLFLTNKREWELYYDLRDRKELPGVEKRIKNKKKGIVFMVAGVVLATVSLFVN